MALTGDLQHVGNIAGNARPGLVYHFLTLYEHQFAAALALLTMAIGEDYRTGGPMTNELALKIIDFLDANHLTAR